MRRYLFCLLAFIGACAARGQGPVMERPATATRYLDSTTADFGIWFDPGAWKVNPNPQNLFDLEFNQAGGPAYAVLHSERDPIPFDSLAGDALEHFRTAATEIRIVSQQALLFGTQNVLFLTFDGLFGARRSTIYGYYYTGPEGTVQLLVGVPEDLEGKYKPLAQAFLNGLQIGKPDGKPVRITAAAPAAKTEQPNITQLNTTVPYTVTDPTVLAVKEISAGDEPGGVGALKAQAAKGSAKAEFFLALCYNEGKGVDKDPARALALMEQAAAKLPMAKATLGTWYANGRLVPKDLKRAEKLFRDAASTGSPYPQTLLGELLFPTDAPQAIGWFQKAADQRYGEAEYCLAACYANGTGVPKDKDQELNWMQRAAADGNPKAAYFEAAQYYNGLGVPKDMTQVASLLRIAVKSGDPKAENDLAGCLWSGSGTAMNREEALQWYEKAAAQGQVNAEFTLGKIYWKGDGVPHDVEQAMGWFEKAATQGYAPGQRVMASACLGGHGLPKDPVRGEEWLLRAAAQGDARAEGMLAGLYASGMDGIPANPPEAFTWAQKAADAGDGTGELVLGSFYMQGPLVERDYARAYALFQQAAAKGIALAELRLGISLINGLGVEKNITEGMEWIRKAADQGDPWAEFQLGLFLEKGLGLPADPVEAVKWFRFSALQGNPRGENAYGYALATGSGIPQDLVEAYKWYLLTLGGKDSKAKVDATVNMNSLLPKLTPGQIEEGKKRAAAFVPKTREDEEPESFSFGVG
jgi:TPR repeat protein